MNYQHMPVQTKSGQEIGYEPNTRTEGRDVKSRILQFQPVRRCYSEAVGV